MRNLPFERPAPFGPTPVHDELRRTGPIARVVTADGQPAWVIVGAALARQVLSDARFTMAPPGTPEGPASLLSDGAPHARLRRLLSRAFTPRHLERLRPAIITLAGELVAELRERGPGSDLVSIVGRPLPLGVTSHMLGISVTDRERFYTWADAASGITGGGEGFEQAWGELTAYFPSLIAAKRADPGPDLLSEVIAVRDAEDGRLSDDELFTTAISLVFGGYLTVANTLSIGVVHLGQAGGLAQISDVPTAVEEMLRYSAGLHGEAFARYAQTDIDLDGVRLAAGDQVLVRLEAANQDPDLIPDPARFDPARTPNPHLAFGHGPHHCIGAALGRMELVAVVGALAEQVPGLRLACAPEDVPWTGNPLDNGPASLPVTW
ncbi:cytochrome P450 [Nonomuraea sp. NPDC059007]|uniref:cytochrome P450 n=1 Tax=Nonomuraea sp. NPDC059007 TaxID=3346692 RepID=UPI0036C21956